MRIVSNCLRKRLRRNLTVYLPAFQQQLAPVRFQHRPDYRTRKNLPRTLWARTGFHSARANITKTNASDEPSEDTDNPLSTPRTITPEGATLEPSMTVADFRPNEVVYAFNSPEDHHWFFVVRCGICKETPFDFQFIFAIRFSCSLVVIKTEEEQPHRGSYSPSELEVT